MEFFVLKCLFGCSLTYLHYWLTYLLTYSILNLLTYSILNLLTYSMLNLLTFFHYWLTYLLTLFIPYLITHYVYSNELMLVSISNRNHISIKFSSSASISLTTFNCKNLLVLVFRCTFYCQRCNSRQNNYSVM